MKNSVARAVAVGLVAVVVGLPLCASAQSLCTPTHTVGSIQGNGTTQLPGGAHNDTSPLNGQLVVIEGVVVGDFQSIPQPTRSGELRGFFVEEETSDHDADPSTSEALFVFTGSAPVLDVQEGQKVCVSGRVSEFFGMTQLTATAQGSLSLVAADVPLPEPATLDLPIVGDLDDYYEQYEGMRVRFNQPLYVSEYFEVARYGQIVLTQGERPFQYTHVDMTPTAAEYADFRDDLARRRIILDDADNAQNSPLPAGVFFHPQPGGLASGVQGVSYFRGGDVVESLVGVLHWSFAGQAGTDAWRVRPTRSSPVTFAVKNRRPATAPVSRGDIRVATFNVLNYFSTIDVTSSTSTGHCGPTGTLDCRGADSDVEFERQNEKLIAALTQIDADILGLVEIENNASTLAELVTRLNNALGSATYRYIDVGVVGTDAITVAVIYKPAVVQPKGAAAVLSSASFTDPNATGRQRNRPAIAQTFETTGNAREREAFTIVVNHLKSKGADGAVGADVDQLDGQSAWNATRTAAAQYLAQTWLRADPTGQGDADVLIVGDLNAYRGESPIRALRDAGYVDLHQVFEGPKAYSYVFDGQLGYLDHALGNYSMRSQVACVSTWPINADEVPVFDYNDAVRTTGEAAFEAEPTGNPLYEPTATRTSDHDPVLIDINLCPKRGSRAAACQLRTAVAQLNCLIGN